MELCFEICPRVYMCFYFIRNIQHFVFLAPRKASAVVKVCGGLEERWTIILHFRGACKVPTLFLATEHDRIDCWGFSNYFIPQVE